MTTGIRWLASLPPPERDNFGDTFEEVRRRSPMEIGPVRQRRMRRASPRQFTVTFRMNQAQYTQYDLWFQNDIQGGALPFDIQLLDDDESYVWYTCYWMAPPTVTVIGANADMWSVQGVLRTKSASFATRPSGTNELGGSAFVGVQNYAQIFVETALYGIASVGIEGNEGRLPVHAIYGAAAVGIAGLGQLTSRYDQLVAHIGVTGAGMFRLPAILYGSAKVGVTAVGNIPRPTLRGISNVGVSNTGMTNNITANDPTFSQVSLLMHFEGSNGSTTLIDSSTHGFTSTCSGDTKLDTSWAAYGSSSLSVDSALVNSTHATVSVGSNAAMNMGSGDFSIEFYVKLNTATTSILVNKANSTGIYPWQVYLSGVGVPAFRGSDASGTLVFSILSSQGTLSTGVRHFIQAIRHGDTFTLAVNGVNVGSMVVAAGTALYVNTDDISLGNYGSGANFPLIGNMDELRITKGWAAQIINRSTVFPDS